MIPTLSISGVLSRSTLTGVGLAALVVAVYWQAFGFDFVTYDDPSYVTDNYHVFEGFSRDSLVWAFTTNHVGHWHPLTWLSLMLDCHFFGIDPAAHHRTSVLIHAASTVMLFLVLRYMTASTWPSAFVAALFAIHPLNVQSVAWIAERKNVLSTFFWIATMGAYARYTRVRGVGPYGTVLLLFALGLMSKAMLVTLPCVLLLLDYWPLRRIRIERLPWRGTFHALWPRVVEKIPLFAMAAAASVAAYWAQHSAGAVSDAESTPFSLRMANLLISYVAYVLKMVWPFSLAFHYPYPHDAIGLFRAGFCALVLLGLTAWALRHWRTRPYLIVGWLWYAGTLVPVSGIVQVGSQAMADRFAYVPLIGLFVAIAWGLEDAMARFPALRRSLPVAAVAVLVLLTARTLNEIPNWRNDLALFGHAAAVTRENAIAHNNYGTALWKANRHEEAVPHFMEALRIRPNYAGALVNLSNVLKDQGKLPEAVAGYRKALEMDPNHAGARTNLGLILLQGGNVVEATEEFRKVVDAWPMDAKAHNSLGVAFAAQGLREEAIREFETALRLKPDYQNARANLDLVRGMSPGPPR